MPISWPLRALFQRGGEYYGKTEKAKSPCCDVPLVRRTLFYPPHPTPPPSQEKQPPDQLGESVGLRAEDAISQKSTRWQSKKAEPGTTKIRKLKATKVNYSRSCQQSQRIYWIWKERVLRCLRLFCYDFNSLEVLHQMLRPRRAALRKYKGRTLPSIFPAP